MQSHGSENIAKAYGRAAKAVRQHPLRIYSKERLLQVHGFGPATSSVCRLHTPGNIFSHLACPNNWYLSTLASMRRLSRSTSGPMLSASLRPRAAQRWRSSNSIMSL